MKIAIVSDFSKTLTSYTNPTTWSVFAKSGLLWEKYTKKRQDLYNIYREYEEKWNVEKTKEWWEEHLKLFVEFWLNLNLIKKIVSDETYFKPREWLNEFFDFINNNNIELVIISSSWVSNFVKEFLRHKDINLDKIKIIWNSLVINEIWKVIWFEKDIISSLNKWDINLSLKEFDKVFLLWDEEEDLDMYTGNNTFKIGFCWNEEKWYDIYLWKEGSLSEVINYLY